MSHITNDPMAYSHVFDMTDQFNASDLSYWLIGGYAIELIVGKRIRDHSDVDFMVDVRDAGRMVEILSELGYKLGKGSVAEGLAYYNRGTEEVCVVPIDSTLAPPATVGRFKGMKFPERFLDTLWLQIDSHKIPTLQPRMHVSMKHIVSEFFGSGSLREKDIIDIQHLADF